MTLKDSLSLAWRTNRSNRLRTGITIAIIALGIGCLIWFLTTLKAASNSLTSSFSTMGANAFSIRFRERTIRFGGGNSNSNSGKKTNLRERKSSQGRRITYEEARAFKQNYKFPALVGIALRGPSNVVVNNEKKKTNPDINVLGGDENYLDLNGYKLATGRNFSNTEVDDAHPVCMLGSAVAQKLFPDDKVRALEKVVWVDHIPHRVIGVLEEKSSSAFFNTGKVIVTPYNNIRRLFSLQNSTFNIMVQVPEIKLMDAAVGEAKATFRPIRKLDIKEEDNFYIDKSDSIASAVINNLGFLEKGIIGVALITLIASAIGLMNIMLVAVNERTREIGIIKALGGTRADIRRQFLFESVLISLMGSLWGIFIGIVFGNILAMLMNSTVVVLWGWIFGGIIICSLVGLAAGLYPAMKASRLDPIVALRYE